MNGKNKIKLNCKEKRNLIELGLYMFAEVIREDLEEVRFKQEQGIY